MKKRLDELKEEAAATFVTPNSGKRKMQTFNDVTEAIDYYKSKSSDSKLSTRQRCRYKSIYDFISKPDMTLPEIYKRIERGRENEISIKERGRHRKEKEKGQGSSDHNLNNNGLGASTEQAEKKKKKTKYVKLENLPTKEEIGKALEERKRNSSESYKKSLQTLINIANNPKFTLADLRSRILYNKQRHNKASQSSKKRLRDEKLKPSSSTTAPIQTSSRPQSPSTPAPPRPQSLVIQTSPKSQPLNVRTSTNLSDSIVQETLRSQHPGARTSTNSPISNVQEVLEIRSPITQTSPKSKSPNIQTSPKSPNLNMQRIPKSQSPQNEERRDSNESIPRYLYEGVDNEEDWMSVWGLDYE